jgi:3-oxoacyl-[acyl-carrier-protein] synthase-3
MIGQAKYTDKKNLELMGYFASLEAIKDAKIDPSEIDGVIVATMTSDTLCPNSAVTLADMLGLGEVGTIVNNTACSGFLDALGDAYAKVLTGIHKNVLVVAADQLQTRMDWADPTTAILFGDGAGAAIIGRTEKPGIKSFWAGSNYSENITMAYGDKLVMGGGPLVLKKAVNAMHHTAVMAMERAGKMMDEIAFVLPHQANLRILQELARKFGIEEKRMLISVQKIANISAATVPVTLDQYRRGQLAGCPYKPGALLVATSVGGGYSFAGSVFEA